ncbi:MAG: glutamate 5-kinase [Solirubrobacteraceae bacterium]
MPSLVIKLGSSVVARDDGTVRMEILAQVCDQLAALHAQGIEPVVVSSGAIAHGLGLLGTPPAQRPRAVDALQAASAVGQGRLYRVYDELLSARGVRSAQVLLTFFDLSARSHYLNARRTLRKLLDWRVVPIINENDTTTTDDISFGDNDFLAAQVAILIGAQRLLLLTNTDGVFTADPRRDPDARLVARIDDLQQLEQVRISHRTSVLGAGGMRSKVVAAEMATAAGIPTVIANGQSAGTILAAADGQALGTTFAAQSERHSSFKLWLKYSKPVRGRVQVDRGAAQALREGGTSLLPVGVVAVDGGFEAGDAVEVVYGEELVGKGISSYSAQELRRVRGRRSAEVHELLPQAGDEAIHRDYFVLA